MLRHPDSPWQVHATSIKPWPSCRHTHPVIDAALEISARVDTDAIAWVEASTYRAAVDVCDRPLPASPYEAKFSLQHCIAAALADGAVGFGSFEAEARARLSPLRSKVRVGAGEPYASDYPAAWGGEVTAVLHDGSRVSAARRQCKGDPEAALDRDGMADKARELMRFGKVADPEAVDRRRARHGGRRAGAVLRYLRGKPMADARQVAKAEAFRALHDGPDPLVLVNASDAATARIVVEAGYKAVATSSAGVAWLMGYADGENIPREEMLWMVRRIAERVDVPVTADMEAGYGIEPEAVADTVRATVEAGAVGMNIEDGAIGVPGPLLDFDLAVARIAAGRKAADETGVPAVLNARCDVFLRGGKGPEAVAEAIRRSNAYREAGADCLFVPFARDAETIGALAEGIDGPLNVLAGAVSPPIPELKRLGVARVSIGGLLSLAFATLARNAAGELADTGTYGFAESVILHPEMNGLMGGE